MRVEVQPALLRWARERSRLDPEALAVRFPKLSAWEGRNERPTLKQIESFAHATHAPVGFFFLTEPPVEAVPIPDFRTVGARRVERPSADLLDTIYLCQQRQEWYRDFARQAREDSLAFVGSANVHADVVATAATMRAALDFDLAERARLPTWTEALRRFIDQADRLGVLVMVNGVVGNNTSRKLDPEEFRGFALADDLAPLVFINGADTKAGQMFTLAHELAHLWLGQSALTDVQPISAPADHIERWCNQVAAELLVPLDTLRDDYHRGEDLRGALDRLARRFKVSTLVILRRIHDAGGISRDEMWAAYHAEVESLREKAASVRGVGGGGDFYRTQAVRTGQRFARALLTSTLEGETLRRDALQLLGVSKLATLHEFAHRLGVD